MRRIHLLFTALVVAAAVTLAACGGSSSKSTSSGKQVGGSSSASGNFCDVVKQVRNDKSLNGNINTLADAKKQVPPAKAAVDKLAAAAPSEIKSDLQTIQRVFTELNDAVKTAKSEQDVTAKMQRFASQSKAADSASTKVDAYAKQHCGTSLSGS